MVLITLGYSLCIGGAWAQLVSVGVKGGVSITEPGRSNDESRRANQHNARGGLDQFHVGRRVASMV